MTKTIIMIITLFGCLLGLSMAQANPLSLDMGTLIKLETSDHPMDVLEFKAYDSLVEINVYTIRESTDIECRCSNVSGLPEGSFDTLIQSTSIGVARDIENVP